MKPFAFAAICALALLAACDNTHDVAVTGPRMNQGVVLEHVELEQQHAPDRCAVQGTVLNATGADHRITLDLHAFNGDGADIAFARPTFDFVAAGARATLDSRLRDLSDDGFLNDCDHVARVELLGVELQ